MKKFINNEFWIYVLFVLAGCAIAILLSEFITPFLNYIIWGIEY